MKFQAAAPLPLILWLAVLAGCGGRGEPTTAAPAKAGQSAPLALSADDLREAGVEVKPVHVRPVNQTIALTGSIVPDQTRVVEVEPMLPGQVVSAPAHQGSEVHAGQTLAVLESVELGEARATFREAKSRAALADAALRRASSLVHDEIVPRKDYLSAKSDAERARAALDAARAKLRMLHVSPDAREADATYPLVSPISGTVIERKAVRGDLAQTDRPLFTVADLSTMWIEADVFEKGLAALAIGMPARIEVAAYPGTVFDGKLTYLADTMDPMTRTLKARIAVANPDRKLKAGMFANVELVGGKTSPALIVPSRAVTLVQGEPAVFVQAKGGFEVRPVRTVPADSGQTRIEAGLGEGERIAVSGVYALKARLLKSQIGSD